MAPRKSFYPFARIINPDLSSKNKIACAVCATSPIQYFKKSAVEIRSLCLADSSSYRGKLHSLDLKFALLCCPFCLANILILKSTLHKGEELGRLNDFLNGLDLSCSLFEKDVVKNEGKPTVKLCYLSAADLPRGELKELPFLNEPFQLWQWPFQPV